MASPREPMKVVHIDGTEVNKKYVITVVDSFSKKSWFILLTSTDAKSTAEC